MKRIMVIAGAVAVVSGAGTAVATAYASSGPSSSPSSGVVAAGCPAAPFPMALGHPSRMLYGESAGQDDKGAVEIYDWQNGQVTAVSGASMTVRSADGTSWTWTLGASTKIGRNGTIGKASDIKAGDKVIVSGRRSGSTRTASAVADPPPDFSQLQRKLSDLRKNLPKDLPNPRGPIPPNPRLDRRC
jgi:Domain of unknown function (DUF5666)